MKRVTKNLVDNLAQLESDFKKAKKLAAAAEKKYKNALEPFVEYLDETLKLGRDKEVEFRGAKWVLEFGKRRQTRKINDQVEALRRLEAVHEGLGYDNISIPLKVLDDQLRVEELADLTHFEYGVRSVKETFIDV